MKFLIPFLSLSLVACQSVPPAPPLPQAEPEPIPHARIPATVSHYMLGAYVDPANPQIRHEAHRIQRVETEAQWDLRPEPGKMLTALEPVISEPVIPMVQPAEIPPPVSVTSPSPEPVIQAENASKSFSPTIIGPDPTGLIDLTKNQENEINPFTVRHPGADLGREVSLQLDGIIRGRIACAVVNGRTVQPGDVVESFVLERIEAHAVLFRHGESLLRVSVGPQPTRIRLLR